MTAGARPPKGVEDFDAFARALGDLRRMSGSPSFTEITARVADLRKRRGSRDAPGKVTVYDCFRPGRRRLDAALVRDIVLAIGHSETDADEWRLLASTLGGRLIGDHVAGTLVPRVVRIDDVESIHGPVIVAPATAAVTLLVGLPGVGKSTCALEVAERSRGAGADAVVVRVSARGYDSALPPSDAADVLRAVVRTVAPRVDHRAPVAVLRDRLVEVGNDRDITVIVDDVASAAHLAPGLVPARRLRYVLTSRSTLDGLDTLAAAEGMAVERRTVGPLAESTVAARVRDVLGARATPPDAVARLAGLSGGIMLDLEIMLRFAVENRSWTLADVIERFAAQSPDERLRPVLATSVMALADRETRLFRRIGLLAGPVSRRLLAEEEDTDEVAPALEALRAAHLVEVSADGVVTMHDTVRAFARRAALEAEPFSARALFANAVVERVVAAIDARDPDSLVDGVVVGDIWSAAMIAADHGLDRELVRLAIRSSEDLGVSGSWSETSELLRRADGVAEDADRLEIAHLLARACEKLGRFDEALDHLHRAQRLGGEPVPGRTWNIIGNVQRWRSDFPAALQAYGRALDVARSAGNAVTEGRAIGNIADVHRILGDYVEAGALYDRALGVSEAADDRVNLSIVRSNRALLFASSNRAEEAIAEFDALLAENAVGTAVAHLLVVRAIPLLALGRVDEAEESVERARGIAGRSDSFDVVPEALNQRAEVLLRRGDVVGAEQSAIEARRAGEEIGSPLILVEADRLLAAAAVARGDDDTAFRRASAARRGGERIGDRVEAARAALILGGIERRRGDAVAAASWYNDAVGVFREVGHTFLRDAEALAARDTV
jgi:tetratricopeptide (TPR) repeat protein